MEKTSWDVENDFIHQYYYILTLFLILQLPSIMADNAGYDSAQLVSELRAIHTEGKQTWGMGKSFCGAVHMQLSSEKTVKFSPVLTQSSKYIPKVCKLYKLYIFLKNQFFDSITILNQFEIHWSVDMRKLSVPFIRALSFICWMHTEQNLRLFSLLYMSQARDILMLASFIHLVKRGCFFSFPLHLQLSKLMLFRHQIPFYWIIAFNVSSLSEKSDNISLAGAGLNFPFPHFVLEEW